MTPYDIPKVKNAWIKFTYCVTDCIIFSLVMVGIKALVSPKCSCTFHETDCWKPVLGGDACSIMCEETGNKRTGGEKK